MDAYVLQHDILFSACAPREMGPLLITIIGVLASFGENIRCENVSDDDIAAEVSSVMARLGEASDEALLNTQKVEFGNHVATMQAFNTLVNLAYVARPKLYPYFVARWTKFHLKNKVQCAFTPAVYITFAVVMCQDINSSDIWVGHRIGKLGLRLQNEYVSISSNSELPSQHLLYYGHVGILFEPIQVRYRLEQWVYFHEICLSTSSLYTGMH